MNEPTPTSGDWRQGKFLDTVVSDCNCGGGACDSPVSRRAYFGGHLVAMRIENPADVPLIAAAKKTAEERDRLLAACKLAAPALAEVAKAAREQAVLPHEIGYAEIIAAGAREVQAAIAKTEKPS